MRTLLKVQGSPAIGMGHIFRSLELGEELRSRLATVVGFCCNGDTSSQDKIRQKGFRVWSDSTKYHDGAYIADLIAANEIDTLILDQPDDQATLCKSLKASFDRLFIVALDYFNMNNAKLDLIVNLVNHHPTMRHPSPKNIRYYEGIQFGIIRKGFDPYIAQNRIIRPLAENILITFGGSDPKQITLKVMEALQEDFPFNTVFHFMVGINFTHREAIFKMVANLKVRHEFHENIPRIEDRMLQCDIGVSGAGTTMMEMACLGTPAVIIAQSQNEARFGQVFSQHGAVKNMGFCDDVTPEKIREALIALAEDKTTRRLMSMAGKKLVDGKGRERLATLIIENFRTFGKGRG